MQAALVRRRQQPGEHGYVEPRGADAVVGAHLGGPPEADDAEQQGETEWIRNSDEERVITYLRRSADEEFLVAINFSNHPFMGFVEAGSIAAFTEVTPDIAEPLKPNATEEERAARRRQAGLPALALDAWGFRIFRRALR